jgi:hypothetical protein
MTDSIRESIESAMDEIGDIEETSDNEVEESVQEDAVEEVEETPDNVETEETQETENIIEKKDSKEKLENPNEDSDNILSKFTRPPGFNEQEMKVFEKMPEEAKKLVKEFTTRRHLALDSHINKVVTTLNKEYEKASGAYKELDNVLNPYKDKFRREGRKISDAIDNLLAWDDYLQENPQAALSELAQQYYGTHPYASNGSQPNGYANTQIPEVEETNEKMLKLASELEEQKAWRQSLVNKQAQTTVAHFFNAKDKTGELAFPYAKELEREMADIVPTIKNSYPQANDFQILQAAYDKVVWSNPHTRALMLDKVQQSKKTQINKQANRSAQAKRSAASIPTSGGYNQSVGSKPKDLRSMIESVVNDYYE